MRRVLVVLLLAIAGCSSPPSPSAPQSAPSSTGPAPACPDSADLVVPADGFPQREGVGSGATLWAMFFGTRAVVDKEIKIAWRMTGSGELTITATGPDGQTVEPARGPEVHSGSSFRRPGDEWGTAWIFPEPGCWTINAVRESGSGRLALRVAPEE